MNKLHNPESGNVVVFILIGVILFAALIYTFTESGSDSITGVQNQQTKLSTAESNTCTIWVNRAVDKLKLKGCPDAWISYELADGTNANANAPVDESCHVFRDTGGKATACGTYLDPIPPTVVTGTITQGDTTTIAGTPAGWYFRCPVWGGSNCVNMEYSLDGTTFLNRSNLCITKPAETRVTFINNLGDYICNAACSGTISGFLPLDTAGAVTHYIEDDYSISSYTGACDTMMDVFHNCSCY